MLSSMIYVDLIIFEKCVAKHVKTKTMYKLFTYIAPVTHISLLTFFKFNSIYTSYYTTNRYELFLLLVATSNKTKVNCNHHFISLNWIDRLTWNGTLNCFSHILSFCRWGRILLTTKTYRYYKKKTNKSKPFKRAACLSEQIFSPIFSQIICGWTSISDFITLHSLIFFGWTNLAM